MKYQLLGKGLAVGGFAVMLSLVLTRISFLVDERAARQQDAVRSVQQSQAGAQTLVGPLLQRACSEEWDSETGEGKERKHVVERRDFTLQASPAELTVDSTLRSEPRYRGLFKVNGYAGHFKLDASWEHADGRLQCRPAVLWLGLSDVRGVREASATVAGKARAVKPGTPGNPGSDLAQGFHVELPQDWPAAADGAALAAHVELELVGTARLALVPVGEATRWVMKSDWPHPSFGGRFLPTARDITDQGFDATWQVSALASAAPRQVLSGAKLCEPPGALADPGDETGYPAVSAAAAPDCLDTLAVSFIDPVNPYVLSDRATKYGLLFVGLTFIAVALVEVLGRGRVRRVHPIQYALVGLALTLFFLLLLSLSEHLAFGIAYGIASAACVSLLGVYTAHMLGRRRDGLTFGGAMALLYGLMYVLLQREQTALVIGSVGLFAAVAAVMWLTRGVDWYRLFDEALAPVPTPASRATARPAAAAE
jgi:inner membrane protein